MKDELIKKLSYWESILQQPRLFIANHFDAIRNEIDLAIEQVVRKFGMNDVLVYSGLNSTREEMISELAMREKPLMDNAARLTDGDIWKQSREAFERANQEINVLFNNLQQPSVESSSEDGAATNDGENAERDQDVQSYQKLALLVLEETSRLEELAFDKQTFLFFASPKNPGVLLLLSNMHFNKLDTGCLR